MHAISVLAGLYNSKSMRFCAHPEAVEEFPELEYIDTTQTLDQISSHRDAQGMVRCVRGNVKFVYDPPTGNFKLSMPRGAQLSGMLQTGKFEPAQFYLRLETDDFVYGFGAANGEAHRNDCKFSLLNLDTLFYSIPETSYTSFPVFMVRRGNRYFGIFLALALPSKVLIQNKEGQDTSPGIYITPMRPIPAAMDFFVFEGSPSEILDQFTALSGRPFLPPAWSMGFHQSRWSYRTADRVRQLAKRFRTEKVPCDAIHLDIHYMDRYRVFTWHPDRFADAEALHTELKELGIRTVAIVDPGVAIAEDYNTYQEGLQRDAYCKTSSGEPYVGKVWPGKTVFPDFSRPEVREWWAEEHAPLFEAGVSGIWNDMNDPVLLMGKNIDPLKEDMHQATGPHADVRNLYANEEAQATNRAFELHGNARGEDLRPFVLTRSAFAGIQRYAAVWTGDNLSTWKDLRENLNMVVNLGLSGVSMSGSDVGGFGGGHGLPGSLRVFKIFRQKELFARWVELGSFMPFYRAHTALLTPDQEPWNFGPEVLEIARKHIRRRYRLLPYIYSLFHESHATGAPVVRPLFYEFPELDPALAQDQFMLGSHILAAPVMERGQRMRPVYLPDGDWYEFESGKKYQGGAEHILPAEPGYFPVFVRAGAILPLSPGGIHSADALSQPPILEIYPAAKMFGRMTTDDGFSTAALQGTTMEMSMQANRERNGNIKLDVSIEKKKYVPPYRNMVVHLPAEYRSVSYRNKKEECSGIQLAAEDRTYSVSRFELPFQNIKAEFEFRPAFRV